MELLDALSRTFDHTGAIVAGIRDDQLATPTPCSDWDVQALLEHTLGVVNNMGNGAAGDPVVPGPATLASDRAAQFRAAADKALAAFRGHEMTDVVDIGAGPMPVRNAVGINVLDTATHAWDMARATGQPADLPDDLAGTVLSLSKSLVSDAARSKRGFNPPVTVPSDASPTAQMVAFLGRQP